MEYGTGAVMAVPAHDQRDFEFAGKYGLPVTVVVQPPAAALDAATMTAAYEEPGILADSAAFSGMPSVAAKAAIIANAEAQGFGGIVLMIDEFLLWLAEKSGQEFVQEINNLLKQFRDMQRMAKLMKGQRKFGGMRLPF